VSEEAITCRNVRRYYTQSGFLRFLFGVLPERSVVLCTASEPMGPYQQCRPRLVADSLETLRHQIASWLDRAFAGLEPNDVPPVYPSLHYAVGRYWRGGRDWIIEADAGEWREAWKAIEPVVGVIVELEVPYTLRYTGHCSPHVCLAEEDMPEPSDLVEALSVNQELAGKVERRLRRLVSSRSDANVHFAGPIARLPYSLNENTGFACIEISPSLYGAFEPSCARPDKVELSPMWPPETRSRRVLRLVEWAKREHDVDPAPLCLFSKASATPTPSPVHPQTDFEADCKRLRKSLKRQVKPVRRAGTDASQAPQGMVYVPPGPFISAPFWPVLGRPWAALQLGRPPMSILETEEYFIDACPVTTSQYAEFIRDGGYEQEQFWSTAGWEFVQACGWHGPSETWQRCQPDLPVRGVSYFEAEAYARWSCKRLPSLHQWEKACRGTDGRRWPWGDDFDETLCNTADSHPSEEDWRPTPVGLLPSNASPYGCLDMVGNVWEWTQGAMVIGGSFASHMRGSNGCEHHGLEPHCRRYKFGFRCVKDVDA